MLLVIFFFAISVTVESRRLSLITGFEKNIIVPGKSAMAAYPAITENESLVYAVCDQTEFRYTEKSCNVTIETPAFVNASFKDTCPINFAVDNVNYITMSRLVAYSFGDDKVMFFWREEDIRDKSKHTKLKILKISMCEIVEVPIFSNRVAFVVIFDDKVELGLLNENYCGSPACKITINNDGQLIDGPTKILINMDFAFMYAIAPVSRLSPNEGFYISVIPKRKKSRKKHNLYKIYWDGVVKKIGKIKVDRYTGFSNSYGYFSVCESSEDTIINCRQYDASMNLKTNATLSFLDYGLNRWIQPHNLQDGSLLLVTGAESSLNSGRYKKFQLIMLYVTKQTPLVIEGLNLKCQFLRSLRVYVLENDIDEICFYFVCDRGDHRRNQVKYIVKCLPKTYLNAFQRKPAVVS